MTYGIIDRKSQKYYAYLNKVFAAINNAQKDYNWLITDAVCYPNDKATEKMLSREFCWLSGDELTDMISNEDFQWIWGCLCGFEKNITLEEVLRQALPSSQDYNGYYSNPVTLQHPLSTVEIIPTDSSYLLLVSKYKALIDSYLNCFPMADDLSLFNQE